MAACEGKNAAGPWSFDQHGLVSSGREQFGIVAAHRQKPMNKLPLTVSADVAHCEQCFASGIIYSPSIVRVDEAEIFQFTSLIDVRDAWQAEFERRLNQTVDPRSRRHLLDEMRQVAREILVGQQIGNQPGRLLLIIKIRILPA